MSNAPEPLNPKPLNPEPLNPEPLNKEKKFYFDLHNFDVSKEEVIEEEIIDLEPPPPSFSEDELEAAKAVAQAGGHSEGMLEERRKREQYIAETLHKISANFSTLFAAEIYRERQYEEEALKLGLEIITLLAPSLNNRLGEEALKNALHHVLKTQSGHSEVRIEVHPDTAPDIDSLIETIWPDKEIAPNYKIAADNNLEKGACAISWKDGGMIRDPQKMANDIKVTIEELLVEQIMSKNNSSLTVTENNAIKNEEPCDSSEEYASEEQNGEEENE